MNTTAKVPRECGPLPFRPGRLDGEYDHQQCYGGAVNAVSANRYQPVPSTAEGRLSRTSDGAWWIVDEDAAHCEIQRSTHKSAIAGKENTAGVGTAEELPLECVDWLAESTQTLTDRPLQAFTIEYAVARWRNRIITGLALTAEVEPAGLEQTLKSLSVLVTRDVVTSIAVRVPANGAVIAVEQIASVINIAEYRVMSGWLCVVGVPSCVEKHGGNA